MSGFFPATAMPDREWWGALWPDPEGCYGSWARHVDSPP